MNFMRPQLIANFIPRDAQGFFDCDMAQGICVFNGDSGTVRAVSPLNGDSITIFLNAGQLLKIKEVRLVPGGHAVESVAAEAYIPGMCYLGEFPIVYLKADHTIIA